ncbi:hypothetical protein [Micromonospora sediminicola]|uniref:hypothetical protein n=1 Tax=Micromonospora sediminicola TaxID=946078 RepID=UPI0037B1A766
MSTETVRSYERKANPEGRRVGAAARHSPKVYAASIAKRWPALTAAQRAEVSAILTPLVTSQDGGQRADG